MLNKNTSGIAARTAILPLAVLAFVAISDSRMAAQDRGTLDGALFDPQGALVPNSVVSLRWNDLGDEVSWDGIKRNHKKPGKKALTVYTDAVGRFSLKLFPGAWDVFAYRDGFVPICTVVTIKAGKATAIELRFPRAVRTSIE